MTGVVGWYYGPYTRPTQIVTLAGIRQGAASTWSMTLGNGLYDDSGETVRDIAVMAQAIGSSDALGAEIIAEDMLGARLAGAGAYTTLNASGSLTIGDLEHGESQEVEFRILVPEGADTSGSVKLYLTIAEGWVDANDSGRRSGARWGSGKKYGQFVWGSRRYDLSGSGPKDGLENLYRVVLDIYVMNSSAAERYEAQGITFI